MLALSEKFGFELTILWINNEALNTSFDRLFMPFHRENVTVVDLPSGFPEDFGFTGSGKRSNSMVKNLVNKTKRFKLNKSANQLLKRLQKIDASRIIDDWGYFRKIYASFDADDAMDIHQMDLNFLEKTQPVIEDFIMGNAEDKFISTCYRIHPLADNYQDFKPVSGILDTVATKVGNVKDSYGLHVRTTDHKAALKFSPLTKFISLIEATLDENQQAEFFLSTDSASVKSELTGRFGSKILFNDVSSYDRNHPDAAIDALIDLFCLARTKRIYGSHHSSFSQTAADIGNIEKITVK
ncbi:hypothetical protein ABV409_15520 [Flagellimonas sp. DF-77]|uniref:hypothetical protein n=1 Tax=Flagellimonas algarum TaxID=3230298 RepID=UPI0033966BF2